MTRKHQSHSEREVVNFIHLTNTWVNHRDIIPPQELDIYLPDYNFAIEFNGDFWHSQYEQNYHVNKTRKCEKKGIQLFHIFESEWRNVQKQAIWKSLINIKLGRNPLVKTTEVREVEKTRDFLRANHLEGWTLSTKNLGLYHEDELVSLACFGEDKLLRFCSKSGLYVKDAFKILLKAYGGKITYYANRRWNYFPECPFTAPNLLWLKVNNNELYPGSMDVKMLLHHYDPEKSEYENILDGGYRPIWDSGNWVVKC